MSTSEFIIETHNPLESTVHISHIAQHAVAGERHAFSFEEERSQETEDRMREAELARGTSRRNSRNSRKTRHFERSGAESRNPYYAEASRRERNLSQIAQITRIFLFYANRCPLMPAKAVYQIPQSRTTTKREQARYKSAGWLALASTKCGRKICGNQRNLREIIS